jgi:hypothetical protein
LPTSADDLRKHFTAVTIQTNLEVAQQAIRRDPKRRWYGQLGRPWLIGPSMPFVRVVRGIFRALGLNATNASITTHERCIGSY